jgi:hypothetical protein
MPLKRRKKRSKHNVDKTLEGIRKRTVNGILFDSEIEARYYKTVILPEIETGEITEVKIHPKYILQDAFEKYGRKYLKVELEADFEIHRGHGVTVVDVKGLPTETARLKRKLFDKKYPHIILFWTAYSKNDGGWIDYDTLAKLRASRKRAKKRAEKRDGQLADKVSGQDGTE